MVQDKNVARGRSSGALEAEDATGAVCGYANTMVRGTRPKVFELMGRPVPVAPAYPGYYTSLLDIRDKAAETTAEG